MKKIFTLFGALLLWQSVAVAQNYLHISSGDSVKKVRFAELDSVTIRDKYFYGYDWEYLTMGTCIFSHTFSGDMTTPVYKRQMSKDGTKWQFKFEEFIYEPLFIDYDSTTGRCHIQPQATGYVYGDYGMIMITDGATYTGDEETYVSTFNEETGRFELYIVYYVQAATVGHGYEYLYLQQDMEASAPARARSIQEVKLDVSNKVSLKPLTKVSDLQQIKPQAIGNKELKDYQILQPCTTLEIDK